MQLELIDTSHSARSRFDRLADIAENAGQSIIYADGCCEPGYDDKEVVLGDWNTRTVWHPGQGAHYETVDDTMPRLAVLFDKLGYAVEWDDEWILCDSCGRAFRCSANSYAWTMFGWVSPCGCCQCGDCVRGDPGDYLGHLSGNDNVADTIGIDLAKYGYRLREEGFENGWYGREDSPQVIGKQLREQGITDYIFAVDANGQFATRFSVWVKENEI